MGVRSLLDVLGPDIDDPEEGTKVQVIPFSVPGTKEGTPEAFLLFSQSIPSQNLGFVDSKATKLELAIGSRELLIHQSPTILSSNRGGGTTGAGKCFPRFLYTTDIGSCLENHAFVRIMDYINLEFVIQARHPRFQC
jgi:hypothetical protein